MKRTAQTQQGMALIEALIASAVLGIGLVGATQLTLKTLHIARESRQNTVAQHLAQEAMDCLTASTGLCPTEEKIQAQGTLYTRQMRSTTRGNGLVRDLQVSVSWAANGTQVKATGRSSASGDNRIEWHSSASALPAWVSAP